MVIACLLLNRFAEIIIRWNHNKTTKLTSSKTWKYLNYIRRYTISKLKNKKAARFGIFFQKKYKYNITACSFTFSDRFLQTWTFFKGGIWTLIQISISSWRVYFWPIRRPTKLTNFLKKLDFDPSAKSFHVPDHDKL